MVALVVEAVKWESYSQAEQSSGPRIIDGVTSSAMVVVVLEEESMVMVPTDSVCTMTVVYI